MSAKHHRFTPDWCVRPGATLAEWMQENGHKLDQAATMCRRMKPTMLQAILDGEQPITPEVAGALQAGTGITAKFWLNLERDYREGLAVGRVAA